MRISTGESEATPRVGLPFGAVACLVLLSLAVSPSSHQPAVLAAAVVLLGVSVGMTVASLRPSRSWLDPAVAHFFCLFVLLAREAGGGASSGISPLYLVPILWVALTGTRMDLYLSCSLVVFFMVMPTIVVGAPNYPASDWREIVVVGTIGITVGNVVQRAVERMRAEADRVLVANIRVERLVQDAPQGVALLDSRGRLVRVNHALATLLDESLPAMIGRPLSDWEIPGESTLVDETATLRTAPEAQFSAETTLLAADGSERHVVVSGRTFLHGEEEDMVMLNVVDISERRRYEERLAHLVDHDPVTGLASRHRFETALSDHLESLNDREPCGALVLLDLDHFKQVNDTLGHNVGDQALAQIGAVLARHVRGNDLVARLGGDEFAILLRDGDEEVAVSIGNRLVSQVAAFAEAQTGSMRRLGASVGVVTFRTAAERKGDALALADMTMYDAKQTGRGRMVLLAEGGDMQPGLARQMGWQSRIEDALEDGLFELHLQPIMDMVSGRVVGAESLLRLREPRTALVPGALVLPGEFMPVAEAVGLVPRVDAWALNAGIEMLSRLRQHVGDFRVEFNISGLSLGEPVIEETLTGALDRWDVPASAVVLEITETAAVADVERAQDFVARMGAMGCEFALDDFGSGFGSFASLKQLNFDYVKIDGEFVSQAPFSGVDRAILHSISKLARKLGKRTVAEYVSSVEVLAVVREEGIDLAQGFLVGRPVPYEEFVRTHLSGVDVKGDV